jgi:hypothetical protein
MSRLDELDIPAGVDRETGAQELVRFWVSDGADHVSLKVGLFKDEDEPAIWGCVAADIVKHAVRAMMQDAPGRTESGLVAEIEKAFRARLEEAVGISGQLHGAVN